MREFQCSMDVRFFAVPSRFSRLAFLTLMLVTIAGCAGIPALSDEEAAPQANELLNPLVFQLDALVLAGSLKKQGE